MLRLDTNFAKFAWQFKTETSASVFYNNNTGSGQTYVS